VSRLETVLGTLPETIAWPEPSHYLPNRVRIEIETPTKPRNRRQRWALATVIVLALVVGLVPGTRQAVADLFREAGVRIGFVAETPRIDTASLDLGTEIDLEEAGAWVDFDLRFPDLLGRPDVVYIGRDQHVSMVWGDEAVLFTQTNVPGDYAQKGVGPGTDVTPVTIDGTPALWVAGAPHSFTMLDSAGDPLEESTRLAHNVLLWSLDGIVFRLETTGELDHALEIAESTEVE